MSDKKVFFHIGFPKTGSTFLQRKIFPKYSSDNSRFYWGKIFEGKVSEPLFDTSLVDLIYGDDQSSIKAIKNISDKIASRGFSQNLISYEGLTFTANSGSVFCDAFRSLSRLSILAEELGNFGYKVELLICLRDPCSSIYSSYVEHYKWIYHSDKLKSTYANFVIENLGEKSELRAFNYIDLLVFCSELSGISNTNVVFYEDFLENKVSFISQLANILDCNFYYDESMDVKENFKSVNSEGEYFSGEVTLLDSLRTLLPSKFRIKLIHLSKKVILIGKMRKVLEKKVIRKNVSIHKTENEDNLLNKRFGKQYEELKAGKVKISKVKIFN